MKTRPKSASTPLFIPLESISIASPCNADWEAMQGDDRARFCSSCAKNVYNLSALTKVEAEALLREKEGKLCVRYFQRPDGTLLTQDCPLGLLRADSRLQPSFALWANATALAMLVAALITGALSPAALQAQPYEGTSPSTSPTPTPTPAPTAAPTPTATPAQPLRTFTLGFTGLPLEPAVTPTPTTPPIEPPVRMGDLAAPYTEQGQIQVAPLAIPTPTVAAPLASMGKIVVPPLCAKPPQSASTSPAKMGEPVAMRQMIGTPAPRPLKSTAAKNKSRVAKTRKRSK